MLSLLLGVRVPHVDIGLSIPLLAMISNKDPVLLLEASGRFNF
jgi:hypothetical protein